MRLNPTRCDLSLEPSTGLDSRICLELGAGGVDLSLVMRTAFGKVGKEEASATTPPPSVPGVCRAPPRGGEALPERSGLA